MADKAFGVAMDSTKKDIVLNEKHNHKKYVPESILQSFASVKGVYSVNLSDNSGLAELSKAIQRALRDLPHVGKESIPKKWLEIRKALENNSEDQISYDNYLTICKKHGVDNEEKAGYISEFLHDLGVILHFQKDLILRNTVVLNTGWVTQAVYLVLFDDTLTENRGELRNEDIRRVWHEDQYRNHHAELLQMMLNFEICYQIGNSQHYIIPELLPEKAPNDVVFDDLVRGNNSLHFEYRYDFMPKASRMG